MKFNKLLHKRFLILIYLSVFFLLTSCSGDSNDEPQMSIAGTTWIAKIQPNESSVPEKYREKGYWILRFTSYGTFSIGIQDENKIIVGYESVGKYRMVDATHIQCTSNRWDYNFTINFDKNEISNNSRRYIMQ